MSKEKNIQPTERKKEQTSVLEKIRRRTGLLVGIVGLALVIFILESLLGSGASIFGGDEMSYAGEINGKKVDRNEFVSRWENQLNYYRQRNQGKEADDATRSQMLETVWQQYIIDLVMKPQFEKIGIVISEDELYEAVVVNPVESIIQNLTDPNTGKVNEQFSRPDGSLDPIKWRQAVQNVTGENEMAVRSMEEQVKSTRYFEKFRNLINKGLYVTLAEAKKQSELQRTQLNISYVSKYYASVPDSAVTITDADLEKFYKENTYQYTNPETARRVEYVTFNVLPSNDDVDAIEKEAIRCANEFKGASPAEDSVIMNQENENGEILIQGYSKKTMVVRDSSIYTAAPGTVYGPYNEGAYYKVYKLQAIKSVADSARVRHILVGLNNPQTQEPKRNMLQAKQEADSIITLLKENRANFDSLVIAYSDDLGSKTNGGDYGWFDENEGFVQPFKDAGLLGVKGNISAVQTQFGYHIIEVLDVSKTRHNSYVIAQIMKLIAPSEETTQAVFAKANAFAGENNSAELFDAAVEREKMSKRLADNIKDGEYQVQGLDGAKELVKWAFTADKGDVSLFSMQDKFVVAKLAGIKNKGILPLDEVIDDVRIKATQKKKGEIILNEFVSKAAEVKNIKEFSAKVGIEVFHQPAMLYVTGMVDGLGRDNEMVGTAFGSKEGVLTKPLLSENGVYVLVVNERKTDPAPNDFNIQKTDAEKTLSGRSDYEVFSALKEKADITFHKSRID